MIHLFDVNFLIALLDRQHMHYEAAHRWVNSVEELRWATCPLTENAFVRITGKPSYPNWLGSTAAALQCLRENCSQTNHTFWPDDISLLQEALWTNQRLISTAHLTDLYLVALAVKHRGKLVSFDRSILAHLIRDGGEALMVLEA
jgi:toxin-antitoxin system PIN domain toxin